MTQDPLGHDLKKLVKIDDFTSAIKVIMSNDNYQQFSRNTLKKPRACHLKNGLKTEKLYSDTITKSSYWKIANYLFGGVLQPS